MLILLAWQVVHSVIHWIHTWIILQKLTSQALDAACDVASITVSGHCIFLPGYIVVIYSLMIVIRVAGSSFVLFRLCEFAEVGFTIIVSTKCNDCELIKSSFFIKNNLYEYLAANLEINEVMTCSILP